MKGGTLNGRADLRWDSIMLATVSISCMTEWGVGFRVQGLGLRVQGLGFRF